jgi:hypothetical protein
VKLGSAELAALVGGIAGVELQLHLRDRYRVALGEHDLDAVLELAVLQFRERQFGELLDFRHAGPRVDAALYRCILAFRRQHRGRLPGASGSPLT